MTKIVINRSFGGFRLSDQASEMLAQEKGWTYRNYVPETEDREDFPPFKVFYDRGGKHIEDDISRTDYHLVSIVEYLGNKANGNYTKLFIVELPKGTKYRITEYDGMESIQTPDDIEWETA